MATVVVASEDFACIDALCAAVEGLGHTAVAVTSAADLVGRVVETSPSVVVLDESMTVFDGFELSAMLRGDPEIPPDLPVLLITSHDVNPRKRDRAGVTECLRKDCDSGEVIDALIKHLRDEAPYPDNMPLGPIES